MFSKTILNTNHYGMAWFEQVRGGSVGLNHPELMSSSTTSQVLCTVLWFQQVRGGSVGLQSSSLPSLFCSMGLNKLIILTSDLIVPQYLYTMSFSRSSQTFFRELANCMKLQKVVLTSAFIK